VTAELRRCFEQGRKDRRAGYTVMFQRYADRDKDAAWRAGWTFQADGERYGALKHRGRSK
jgi:hypothetical protein